MVAGASARCRGVKRKLGAGDSDLRLADAVAVPRSPRLAPPRPRRLARAPPRPSPDLPAPSYEHPFIDDMDEITYWIYTKRAPCLMNYDNMLKKQSDRAKCPEPEPKSVHGTVEDTPSPKKKKKRKLSILDDELVPEEKQKNIYFDTTQDEKRNQKALSSCKSGTVYSDVDFNIKNSSIQGKTKKIKLQKNNRTTLHKKNKVIVTSTPLAPTRALRRSLRNAQNSLNNNSQFNVSYEALNCSALNGHCSSAQKSPRKSKVSIDKKLLNGDHSMQNKKNLAPTETPKKETVLNGQFEDLSDVSGFTANYIRSTKLHSTRTPRNLRNKSSRNLVKESRQNLQKHDSTMVICVNRSMNTTTEMQSPVALNTSTDSSQNAINLVTIKDNGKCLGVNRSTSLLKFVDVKTSKIKENDLNKVENNQANRSNLNVTLQSKNSATSRYPKRHKLHSSEITESESQTNQSQKGSPDKRRKVIKLTEFNNSHYKENPEEKIITRTRSRNIALKVQQPNSVLVLSNVTEHVSSGGTMNVANPGEDLPRDISLKKKRSVKYIEQAKKSVDKSGQSLRRDSLRDRSGFAACFSDSDNDIEPVKERKFFC